MNASDEAKEYLTTEQAARLLRVSPRTVRRWAKQGRIPGVVATGGQLRFPRDTLEAMTGEAGDTP